MHKELKTKEGESYNAWLKLDPEKKDAKKPYLSYGEGYGYDVVKALEKHPVKELRDEAAMKKVLDGLEKGNLVPVTYVKGGNEEKVVAMANHDRFCKEKLPRLGGFIQEGVCRQNNFTGD